MKKKLAVKLAALMLVVSNGVTPLINFPNSLLLWGEPTPPMEKEDN